MANLEGRGINFFSLFFCIFDKNYIMSKKVNEIIKTVVDAGGIRNTNYTWKELAEDTGLSPNALRHKYRRANKKSLQDFCKENNVNINTVKRASVNHKGNWSISVQPNKVRDIDLSEITINTVQSNWKPKEVSKNPTTLVINMSDQHIGMTISKGVFELEWNPEIYEKRLDSVLDKISQEKDYDSIVINMLGDYIDGQDRTTSRRLHLLDQNMNNEEMFNYATHSFIQFLENLTVLDKPIEVNAITSSNHGGFMEYSIWGAIKLYCQDRFVHNSIKINICNKFLQHTKIGKYDVIITHGYDDTEVVSRNKMPKIIKPVWENKIGRYIKHYGLENVILIRGDLHQYNNTKFAEFRDFLIPSFCNSSGHIQHNYLSDSQGGYVIMKLNDSITSTHIEF